MKKYDEIAMEIYRLQYKQAIPHADFDALVESGETKKEGWFWKYYLDQGKQQVIIESVCKKHKLKEWEKKAMSVEINLGCSPNTSYKTWKEERKKCQVRNLSAKKKSKK